MAQTLFTIEVLYLFKEETKRYILRNMTADKLKQFRETVVTGGLMLPADYDSELPDLDQWYIILPHNIDTITVWRQQTFFKPDHQTSKKATV